MDYCANGALVTPQSLILARLAAMIAADGELETPKVLPFVSDVIPSPSSILADYTAPSSAGIAAKTVVWGTPYPTADGGAGVSGGAPDWVTTSAVDETVYGWRLTDSTGADLKVAARLAVPQHLGAVGAHVQVNVEYTLPGPVGDVVPVV